MKKHLSIILATVLIFSLFIGCKSQEITIDAKEIAAISFSGLNTKGNAFVEKDQASVDLVVNAYRSVNNKDSQKVYTFLKAIDSIKFQVSPRQNGLSNGDELTITTVYDAESVKSAKIKIENIEFKHTVSGLTEPIMVDPFAEIELAYEGISPWASVEVFNRSEKQFVRDIRYVVEPNRQLRIGDKVTVTAELDAAAAEQQGLLVPDVLAKEYTVEGIDEYITDFNDIDQETKDKMQKESFEIIESDCAHSLGFVFGMKALNLWTASGDKFKNTTVDEPELTNIYFNTLKQGSSGDSKNIIFYVYKITAHYAPETEPRTAYAAVRFKNAVKKADESIEIDLTIDKYTSNLSHVGATHEDIYKAVVTANKALFEIQEITP